MVKNVRKKTIFLGLSSHIALFFLLMVMSSSLIWANVNPYYGKSLSNTTNYLQQHQVSGKVTDTNGMPLPGANVIEKGTTNGVISDFDGQFSIDISNDGAILVVSYVGFAPKEVTVNGQTIIDISLEESAEGLDEVVVVGYGTQKKAKITGAISTVKVEDIANVPTPT